MNFLASHERKLKANKHLAHVVLIDLEVPLNHPQFDPDKPAILAFFQDDNGKVFSFQTTQTRTLRIYKSFNAAVTNFMEDEINSDYQSLSVMIKSNPAYVLFTEQAILLLEKASPGIFTAPEAAKSKRGND